MFVIRRDQIEAMGASMIEASLQKKLLAYLRGEYPEALEGMDAAEVAERGARALAEARDYGMTWESSLFAFAALTFVLRPDFHDHPPIRAALLELSIDPNLRLQAAAESLSEEEWDSAAEPQEPGIRA